MPAFEAAETIGEAIESVLAQSFEDFELVIVNDGSSDGTGERARAFSDPRIRVLDRPHEGVVGAANATLQAARGQWIARLDADDRMHPDRLIRQLDAARPDTLMGTAVRFFPEAVRAERPALRRYEGWLAGHQSHAELLSALLVDLPIAHPSLFGHRDIFEALGGYRAGDFQEDYDLIVRAVEAGYQLANLPEVLTFWREHPKRLTRTAANCKPEAVRRFKASVLARWVPSERPLWIWGAGREGRRLLRALEGKVEVAAAVDIDPRKFGRLLRDRVPVVPAKALWGADPRPYVLVAVAAPGARRTVQRRLLEEGFAELDDFRALA